MGGVGGDSLGIPWPFRVGIGPFLSPRCTTTDRLDLGLAVVLALFGWRHLLAEFVNGRERPATVDHAVAV